MEVLREVRKTLTFGLLRMGMEFGQRSSDASAIEALRYVLLGLARAGLPVRMRLATNLRQAGVYRPGLVNDCFERSIDHLMMLAYVFRARAAMNTCRERFRFDESFDLLRQAYAGGRGVITIAPHLIGFPLYGPVIAPRIPCTLYVRRNKDPRKMRITQAISVAAGCELVYPDEGASKAQRLGVAINVLRQGKVLYITPDTPRKAHEGIPVTILGRTAYFPTGVFVMSLRTGSPVVPAWWHWQDGAYHLRYGEPLELRRGGNLKEQAESATRKWAADIDAFLHQHPEMWWNWLDKRWTRIIRGKG